MKLNKNIIDLSSIMGKLQSLTNPDAKPDIAHFGLVHPGNAASIKILTKRAYQ